jgi:hypothetical protein
MKEALYELDIPDDPTETLPFEVEAEDADFSFAPYYYPDRFPQKKERELNRNGQQSGGEGVTIKKTKNPDFHVAGIVLAEQVGTLKRLLDYNDTVSVYSPLNPTGGIQSIVKGGEVDANPEGYDPLKEQWQFKYTIDIVSTGFDENDRTNNQIVSAIVNDENTIDNGQLPNSDNTQPFQ